MLKFFAFMFVSCLSSFMVYTAENIKIEEQKEPTVIEEKINDELMTLEIPKISFKGTIYKKESKKNNIDQNIIIMNESDMPDKDGGILIIGGHSGYGKYAYFKDLNQLQIDDIVYIYYNNQRYEYKVVEYHLDSKDGSISINNINKKNKLFLYTCNPNDKNNYLVYDCERI